GASAGVAAAEAEAEGDDGGGAAREERRLPGPSHELWTPVQRRGETENSRERGARGQASSRGQAGGPCAASTARRARHSASGVNGFERNGVPLSSTPSWTTAFSV